MRIVTQPLGYFKYFNQTRLAHPPVTSNLYEADCFFLRRRLKRQYEVVGEVKNIIKTPCFTETTPKLTVCVLLRRWTPCFPECSRLL